MIVMNDYRRAAFEMMRRTHDRRRCSPWFFERDVMGREMALSFERMGWLKRFPGSGGRPGTVELTPLGLWIFDGVPKGGAHEAVA